MRCNSLRFIFGIALAVLPHVASASPMVYAPTNPSFGGSPFNGAVLLNEANAQNQYTAKALPTTTASDNLGQLFSSGLTSQIQAQVYADIGKGATSSQPVIVGNVTVTYHPGSNHDEIVTIIGPTGTTTLDVPLQ